MRTNPHMMPVSNAERPKLNTREEDYAYTVLIKKEVEILKEKKIAKEDTINSI